MTNFNEFHDGAFGGMWIDDLRTHVFLSTVDRKHFVFVLTNVAALRVDGFKAGNIIFEVITRNCAELTVEDVTELYDLAEGATGKDQASRLLERAQQHGLKLLEINPSFGGSCLVLAHTVDKMSQNGWFDRYCHPMHSA